MITIIAQPANKEKRFYENHDKTKNRGLIIHNTPVYCATKPSIWPTAFNVES